MTKLADVYTHYIGLTKDQALIEEWNTLKAGVDTIEDAIYHFSLVDKDELAPDLKLEDFKKLHGQDALAAVKPKVDTSV